MKIVIISGLSGSGKSVALNVLEDTGYYCVDNLPAPMLVDLVSLLRQQGYAHVAVAVDMRSGDSIAALPHQIDSLERQSVDIKLIFFNARTDILIQRFSETRRRHPLTDENITLDEAIRREREALASLATLGHHIDTSALQPNTLRIFIKEFITGNHPTSQLTLLFESFGFKYGIPLDADVVFDVRCIPNPHYDPRLRDLTGQSPEVIRFLEAQPEVPKMVIDIRRFLDTWLPVYMRDNRVYLTVAIGCTGGQHRSVYFAEALAAYFRDLTHVLVRHRSLTEAATAYTRK